AIISTSGFHLVTEYSPLPAFFAICPCLSRVGFIIIAHKLVIHVSIGRIGVKVMAPWPRSRWLLTASEAKARTASGARRQQLPPGARRPELRRPTFERSDRAGSGRRCQFRHHPGTARRSRGCHPNRPERAASESPSRTRWG